MSVYSYLTHQNNIRSFSCHLFSFIWESIVCISLDTNREDSVSRAKYCGYIDSNFIPGRVRNILFAKSEETLSPIGYWSLLSLQWSTRTSRSQSSGSVCGERHWIARPTVPDPGQYERNFTWPTGLPAARALRLLSPHWTGCEYHYVVRSLGWYQFTGVISILLLENSKTNRLLYFISIQLHVSLVNDNHQAIGTLF